MGRRARRAFTLVELLVAMAITLILVTALMQVFTATTKTWQQSEARMDAYREARGALQIMARDLSATLQTSYHQPPASTGPLMPTLVLQRSPSTTPDPAGPGNEEVYCLTNIPNSGASFLCAVGFFCQWMPDQVTGNAAGRAPRAYALMRQSLDSTGTFQRLKAATAGQSASGTAAMPLSFDDLFGRTVKAGAPAPTITQLSAYIWDLRFRIDTDLNEQTFPDGDASDAPLDHSTPPRFYGGDPTKSYPPNLPAYVEIRFKALSEIAARRLEGNTAVTQATWKDTGTTSALYQSLILPGAQQFVLRVPLLSGTPPPATGAAPVP